MKIHKTAFEGIYIVEFHSIVDKRGLFMKPWSKKELEPIFGDNIETYFSSSKKGTMRGLHYQEGEYAQDKFIICLQGEIEDVATDLREDSATYGKTFRVSLKPDSFGVIVPKGFAHGIFSKEDSLVTNFCSNSYYPEAEKGISWFSIKSLKDLKVSIVSDKDKNLPRLDQII